MNIHWYRTDLCCFEVSLILLHWLPLENIITMHFGSYFVQRWVWCWILCTVRWRLDPVTADEARTSKCLGICACELHFLERFFPQPPLGTLGNWMGEFLFVFLQFILLSASQSSPLYCSRFVGRSLQLILKIISYTLSLQFENFPRLKAVVATSVISSLYLSQFVFTCIFEVKILFHQGARNPVLIRFLKRQIFV